jgi:hypothetical protein
VLIDTSFLVLFRFAFCGYPNAGFRSFSHESTGNIFLSGFQHIVANQ